MVVHIDRVSVLVPSYKRPDDLLRCLTGLESQTRLPDEVVVITRETDTLTNTVLAGYSSVLSLQVYSIRDGGQVSALNAGLMLVTGDIVCITDDDAIPRPDWIQQIVEVFNTRHHVGGVGGRDWVHHATGIESRDVRVVGKITWYGRIVGNHHLGTSDIRTVDILKGVNMSFRREAIVGLKFDERLHGNGAQVHNDMDFCMAVKRKGWELIYDPNIAVDHFPAERFDEDHRVNFNHYSFTNAAYNETYVLLKNAHRLHRFACLVWGFLVGSKSSPGIIQSLRSFPRERFLTVKKMSWCVHARIQALRTWWSLTVNTSSDP